MNYQISEFEAQELEISKLKNELIDTNESNERLTDENCKLKAAIKDVVSQRADNLCWMDIYTKLGHLVGMPTTLADLAMLPTDKLLANCKQYDNSLKTGCDYQTDYATAYINKLEEKIATLEKYIEGLEAEVALRTQYNTLCDKYINALNPEHKKDAIGDL